MYMNRKGVQFSYKDTWNLDGALSPIILNALNKFQEVTKGSDFKGIPGKLLVDMFPDVKYDYSEEQSKLAEAEWERILETMIYAFDKKNEPNLKDYNFKFGEIKFEEQTEEEKEKGYRTMKKITNTNQAEYDRYREDEKKYSEKVQEGYLLFGKFYDCLWW